MAEPPTAPAPDITTADQPTPVAGWSVTSATPGEPSDASTGRRRRPNRWDRPKPPHDWRFWVGGLGRVLIATGLLLLGFVAYQLWGTGIETARAQRSLENDFEELLADAAATTTVAADPGDQSSPDGVVPSADGDEATSGDGATPDQPEQDLDASPADDAPAGEDGADAGNGAADPAADARDDDDVAARVEVVPADQQLIPLVENGDALFRLEIPSIGTNDIVVAGVETSDLKKGPGHFPETPLPGQLGNSAVAGHRTTYGQPFHNVDKLEPGDEMIATTLSGTFVYVVTDLEIVRPSDYHVIATTDPTIATLTLTSCDPKWTAENRIIIHGVLDPERSAAVGEPVLNYGQSVETDDEPSDTTPVEDEVATADAADAAESPVDAAESPADAAESPADAAESPADAAESPVDAGGERLVTDVDERLVGVEALSSGTARAGTADAFTEGWFSDSGAYGQVALWAAALIAIWAGAYLLARRFRRTWVGLVVGIVPFVVALYFFYQNVNRMLPPNL